MSFDNQENKAFLWNMLLENGIMSPTQSNIEPLQHMFESIIKAVDKEMPDNRHILLEKNKQFIRRAIEFIPNAMKGLNEPIKQQQVQQQYQNHQQNEPHLRQEIKKQRHEEMNGKLKTKQEEFSKLINANRPGEIDFSDKSGDEEVIKNFQIDRTLEQREKELQNIMMENSKDTKKDAEKWITNSAAKPQEHQQQFSQSQGQELWNGRLKIQDNISNNSVIELDIKDKPITDEKRVSFNSNIEQIQEQIQEPNTVDASIFLSKLKRA